MINVNQVKIYVCFVNAKYKVKVKYEVSFIKARFELKNHKLTTNMKTHLDAVKVCEPHPGPLRGPGRLLPLLLALHKLDL